MRKMLFLFSAIILIVLLSACNDTDEEEKDATSETEDIATTVEVDRIKKGNLTVERTVFGHVLPKKQTPVLTQQPGEITDVKVKTGDEVKKDERLGTIKTEMGSLAINAPIAGTVGQLTLEKNDFHNGEDPFAIIFDDEIVEVQLTVTPEMKSKFKVDKKYKAVIDGEKHDAEVTRIEDLPNEAGQYEVVAQIENDEESIMLGSVAEVVVKEVLEKDKLIIPTEAIVTDSDETYIFIIENDKAKKITVEVLESQSKKSAIDADVDEKAKVITSGQFLLTDGSKVDVVKDGK